jgi:conjugal transfer pilus assembly protein TraU
VRLLTLPVCATALALAIAPQAMARDYGLHGAVWPVIEPDLLQQIHARLTQLEKTGETARLNEELKRRTIARVNRPEPVAGVTLASALRSWRFDPTITVERDIADDKGRLIIAAGTRVNPLDTVPLRAPLVFLDGDDPAQLAWATPSLCQHKGQAHPRAGCAARTHESPPAALLLRSGRHAGEALRHSRGAGNRRAAGPHASHHRTAHHSQGASAIMRRKPRILSWLCGALLLASLSAISSAPAHAAAGPGRCTGKFVNPITDICWSCLFPISIGGLKIWPSSRPDTSNPALPVCLCGLRPGIAMGFWEPVRLADVSMKPWCFVNLGGMKLDPGFDIGFKSMAGPSAVGGNTQYNSQWHVHWYAYPLIYWMEIVADFLCLESGSIDILYITEIDPLWQDSELTAIINPEAVLFANPLALAACAADCVAATAKLPTDELFWCAGCQGTMYPLNGNVSATIGHVQASRLALARFSYKLHRELVAWGTMGSKGLCGKYLMPVMRKQQYRFQATNPNPQTKGRYACAPIGASTTFMSAGQVYPAIGEDMGYLVWRKRNCCAL